MKKVQLNLEVFMVLITRHKRIVVVVTKAELTNLYYYRRLWIAMVNKRLSSRKWMDEISNALYFFDGIVINSDGTLFEIPDVDEVINRRSISNFLQDIEGQPRRIARKFEAAQLYDLAFRCRWPLIARHFSK